MSLKIAGFPLERIRDGAPIHFSGRGFQNSAGNFRSISQYFLENDTTSEIGKI